MREIKFRAWEKEQNVMQDWEYLKGWTPRDWEKAGVAVMQFTGLLDKSGKEIYEGDVVEAEGVQGKQQFKVFWFSAGVWSIFNIATSETFWREDDERRQFQVIGNIYQNPELLTPTP